MVEAIGFVHTAKRRARRKRSIPADMRRLITAFATIIDAPRLRKNQRKALSVMMIPESSQWSIKQKAEICGMSERNYYLCQVHPEILGVLRRTVPINIVKNIPEIIEEIRKDAVSAKNSGDRHRAAEILMKVAMVGGYATEAGRKTLEQEIDKEQQEGDGGGSIFNNQSADSSEREQRDREWKHACRVIAKNS